MASRQLILASTLLFAAGCAPSRAHEAARLINGLTQRTVFDAGEETLPPKLECSRSGALYTFGGGDVVWTFSPAASTIDLQIEIAIDVKGDSIFMPSGNEETSLKCSLQAEYDYDPVNLRALGKGRITSCDGFFCEVNRQRISCRELADALQEANCI